MGHMLNETGCPGANAVPFPMPAAYEAQLKSTHVGLTGPLAQPLESLYASFGTWDVPPSAFWEILRLRVSMPMLLGPFPQRPLGQGGEPLDLDGELFEEAIETIEQNEWDRMVESKNNERCVWG